MKADSLSAPSEPKEDHNLALEADAVPHSDTPEMSRTGVILRKYLSLLVLIIQSTTLVLVMRYSRTVTVDGLKYLPTTAVVLTELLKLSVCVAVVLYKADWNMSHGLSILYTEIVEKRTEMLKISVPGVLYTIQNNLLYLALTYLDAATFQVSYQLKILTTAIFSVIILHKSLSVIKWISLVLLTIAVALVQFSKVEEPAPSEDSSMSSAAVGLLAVLCASVTSGFAGVYTEKILKGSDTSMWIRNIQLALISFFIGIVGVCLSDWRAVMEDGFFQGYSPVVALVICLQALGGLVVATVIKYADNILKGFAAALSILLSSIISYFFLGDFYPTLYFVFGAVLVLVATVMYSCPQPRSQSPVLPLALRTSNPPKSL